MDHKDLEGRDEFGELFLDFSKIRPSKVPKLFSEMYLERVLAETKKRKNAGK